MFPDVVVGIIILAWVVVAALALSGDLRRIDAELRDKERK
jgi:hypothetical protein